MFNDHYGATAYTSTLGNPRLWWPLGRKQFSAVPASPVISCLSSPGQTPENFQISGAGPPYLLLPIRRYLSRAPSAAASSPECTVHNLRRLIPEDSIDQADPVLP